MANFLNRLLGDKDEETRTDETTTARSDTNREHDSTINRLDSDYHNGHDTSGPNTDDAMTRSEERLNVGTETVESGTAHPNKHIVTETQSVEVPVSHEEVSVVREPITDANVGSAKDGPDLSEEEHEVVLHEEVPVVDKKVVPVERVSLGTETVTGQETVSDTVRKENIVVDDDTHATDEPVDVVSDREYSTLADHR